MKHGIIRSKVGRYEEKACGVLMEKAVSLIDVKKEVENSQKKGVDKIKSF